MTNFKDYIGMKDIKLWDGITRTFQRLTSTGGWLVANKFGNCVNVLEVYGSGSNYTDATINTAIAAIGSNTCEIDLTPGTWVISDNLTIPSNLTLRMPHGAILQIASGKVLTICSSIVAKRHLLFTGAGSVKFTNATSWSDAAQVGYTTTVYPEWWGTDGAAVQAAAYSIAAQTASTTSPTYLGGVVELANRYYALTTTLIIPDHVDVRGPNGSARQACLQATGSWTASNPVVQIGRVLGTQYWSHGSQLRNLTVDAALKANVGVYSASANEESGVDGLIIRNYLQKGIWFNDIYTVSTDPRIIHCFIRNTQIFANLSNAIYYPTPSNVKGVVITGLGTTYSYFNNFTVDKVTVSTVGGGVNSGIGFEIAGVAGVTLVNSHAEGADIDVKIGNATYPARNIIVTQFDGYSTDPVTIQLNHANTTAVLQGITNGYNAAITIDDNINTIDITDDFVQMYVAGGKVKFAGNQDFTSGVTTVNRLAAPHSDPAELPMGIIWGNSASTYSIVKIGNGNSGLTNAATSIEMWLGSDNTTTAASRVWWIDEAGTITHNGRYLATDGLFRFQDIVTDATDKIVRLSMGHYTNSEEPMSLIFGQSTSTANRVRIGGGTAVQNAATLVEIYTAANNTTVTGTARFALDSAGALRLHAYGAGTLTTDASGNVTAVSDERLKTITGTFTRGLDALEKITPIKYYWNEDSKMDMEIEYSGFSAQNIQEAIPEAVGMGENGYLTIQDRPILAALVNAIKELQQHVKELEKE